MSDNLRLDIREIIRIVLMENQDVEDIQSHVYSKDKNLGGKLYKREIQMYLKALKEKFGIEVKQFLGTGSFGFAFLSKDNKTIKITSDKSEAVEAKKWMNKNPEHLPKVFNIIKVKVGDGRDDVFVIIKEHILQNSNFISYIKNLETKLSDFLYLYHMRVPEHVFPHFIEQFFDHLIEEQISPEDINKFMNYLRTQYAPPNLIWYVQQIYFLYEEMVQLSIQSTDTFGKNMGLKNKKLIYLDPGYGDYGDGWIEKQPYDVTVAQENLNEDDDTEYATMHNNVKNSVDDKNLQTQPIIKFLDMLHEKFGYKFKKFLGSGTYGFAFLTTDNKTVKLTTDATEMMEARKYQDKNNKHLPNIHKIQKIKVKLSGLRKWSPSNNKVDPNYKEVYLIEKDFVLQNAGLKEKFDNYIWEISDAMSTLSKQNTFFKYDSGSVINYVLLLRDIRDGKIPNKEISKLFQLVKLKDKWAYWFLIQSVELANELRSNRMKVHDIHPANLGIMGRNLMLLDVGYASEVSKVGIKWLSKMPNHAELNQEQKT